MSHLTRGAWIEIIFNIGGGRWILGRTSHEVRGLKFFCLKIGLQRFMSHLTRGAWIEIYIFVTWSVPSVSRTSHEVRGLKF